MFVFLENGHFIFIHLVECVVENKDRKIWIWEDKKKVQQSLKAKTIISTEFGINEFSQIFHNDNTKEVWDAFQITYEGIVEVKRARVSSLTHEYELFRMKLGANIEDMQKYFIHIVNHMRILCDIFQNKNLVMKILGCLNNN